MNKDKEDYDNHLSKKYLLWVNFKKDGSENN